MDYQHYSDDARISPGSILLLLIFGAAAAFIVAMVLWRPWFDDTPSTIPAVEAPAEGLLPGADEVAPAPDAVVEP